MEVDSQHITDGDTSQAESDCQRNNEEPETGSEFQDCNFGRPGLRQERKYSHFTYPTYMMASGYDDSVCAVI